MLRSLAFGIALLIGIGCGDDDGGGDAGTDAPDAGDAGVDVVLPPGPRGDVLRVMESDRFVLPTLEGEVYVLRTEADVPHIYAENDRDLRVAQGFVIARDRYFQIEAGRRLAQGSLSELLGDAALAADQLSRGQGMPRVAARLSSQLTAEQEDELDAYAEGVNAYIQGVKDRVLPAPSVLAVAAPVVGARSAGDLMEPITRDDLISFSVVAIFQLGFEEKDLRFAEIEGLLEDVFTGSEREAARRREGVLQDIFGRVEPLNDVVSAIGFGLESPIDTLLPEIRPRDASPPLFVPRALPVERDAFARLRSRSERFQRLVAGERGEDFGSNAWAIAGDRSEGGAAILAGDGHLPLTISPLFYQMGLDTTVFGDGGDTELMGLFFAGIAPMAVGTNGRVAWSQTFLRGDVTDWYAEELLLDDEGAPRATVFQGGERDLLAVDETYTIADVPALGSVGREETWTRWETFDGRPIAMIEGRPAMADTTPGAGETLVNVQGEFVIPADVDGDGVVSAASFDYTGFDASNLLRALQGFNDSDTVDDFRNATRELVTYAQNLVAADTNGGIYYGSYNALPTREYLPRDEDGRWLPGADPRSLIDGTQHAGFEVPLNDEGLPDETACASNPNQCLVPFDRWPAAINPERGFVLTANNDIGNITTDNNFFNDEFYLGGPWNNGFRGRTIQARLAELASSRNATVADMSALQGDHTSVIGNDVGGFLLEAIEAARAASMASSPPPDVARLGAIYTSEQAAIDEVETRITAWRDRGATAESGVSTFYDNPSADQEADSVATMIFNQWWRTFEGEVFDDEDVDFAFGADRSTLITRTLVEMLEGRGADNPADLASWDPSTEESVFFDRLGTEDVETSNEIVLAALVRTLEDLRSAPDPETPGVGGFGSTDMDDWRWGMRHLVRFESIVSSFIGNDPAFAILANGFSITTSVLPLEEGLPDEDPRASLPWFPRPGDLFNVDAAHWGYGGSNFWYGNGPVMRMVIRLETDNISGVNVLPGGQSGRRESDHFADQAGLWLGNDTVPLRFHVADVVAGAVRRETFAPE
ncbi:MAG: penicillin acylase family protein [Myxococcota bacterium]